MDGLTLTRRRQPQTIKVDTELTRLGIVGRNGVGVAPRASFIACKGCSTVKYCSGDALFKCGQWVQCPTHPNGSAEDCGKAPHIVSNSWGGDRGGNSWYDTIINSWQAAHIIPVFSIGNAGSNCNTARSPGDRPNLISVGSMESNDQISDFSSRGPATENRLKPEISAPGGRVLSAWYTKDTDYYYDSGTSMACPHVSGVIALMLQKNPNLNFNQISNAITRSAVNRGLDTSTTVICGGRAENRFPNNAFGYGRIDAMNCLNAV